MTQVSSTITINAPANAIWQLISDFGAAGHYLAGVVTCTVEGEGVGALRTLTNGGDSTVVERLETLDKADRRLSYSLLTDTPFGNCLTTMVVHGLGSDQAKLVWSASFQPAGILPGVKQTLLSPAATFSAIGHRH
jgi:hypothetical protein